MLGVGLGVRGIGMFVGIKCGYCWVCCLVVGFGCLGLCFGGWVVVGSGGFWVFFIYGICYWVFVLGFGCLGVVECGGVG